MSFFRSNLVIAIVSLFVLTGYACDVLNYDCADERPAQVDQGVGHTGEKAPPQQQNDCKCICHQVFTGPELKLVCVAPRVETPVDFVTHADEFPPEAVPLGIDYPPQLA